ncbi:MAG: lytic murein transglycosylase, partial [Pseudomonadota bacterium]
KNIWTSKKDVFASTANYLTQSGWNKTLKWGWAVKLPNHFAPKHTRKSVIEWIKEGVVFTSGMPNIEGHTLLTLVVPDGGEGRSFLVSKNYDVIKKWNNSTSFALSVGVLSDLIAKPSADISQSHLNP